MDLFKPVTDFVGGLFGGGNPSLNNMATNLPSNTSQWGNYDFSGIQDTMRGLPQIVGSNDSSSGGLFGSAIDWLGQNKDAINTGVGLLNAYGGYQSSKDMQDMMNRQIDLQQKQFASAEAERQRQVAKEQANTLAMQQGFEQSGLGLYDQRDKRLLDQGRTINNSNYYSV